MPSGVYNTTLVFNLWSADKICVHRIQNLFNRPAWMRSPIWNISARKYSEGIFSDSMFLLNCYDLVVSFVFSGHRDCRGKLIETSPIYTYVRVVLLIPILLAYGIGLA